MLVIFPGALGDLVCAGPAISAIARRHRGAPVELMARAELARFAQGRIGVARGHSIDRPEVALCFSASAAGRDRASRFFGAFSRIYSFFASDDLAFRDALTAAAGGPVTFHPFRPDGPGHIAACYLRSIGAAEAPAHLFVEPSPEDIAAASRIFSELQSDPRHAVILFPGSGSPKKNWPVERFAELAAMLPSQVRAIAVLGPTEEALEPVLRAHGVTITKDLELGTVAAVAKMARYFVGNDSGVSHLAAAAG
ncbi:MAG TPA: glycosyltransferase family 9 protein, partial [Candidatus Binataceae bacterium]|nr:glycosyltransferase family 9 protein [Candidatus Binataceae bacterium]